MHALVHRPSTSLWRKLSSAWPASTTLFRFHSMTGERQAGVVQISESRASDVDLGMCQQFSHFRSRTGQRITMDRYFFPMPSDFRLAAPGRQQVLKEG